jgi:hypothetical protein
MRTESNHCEEPSLTFSALQASPELSRGPPSTVVNAIFHLFNEAIVSGGLLVRDSLGHTDLCTTVGERQVLPQGPRLARHLLPLRVSSAFASSDLPRVR